MKREVKMTDIQKNTTCLLIRALSISVILAYAAFPISHPDSISAWTNFRFVEFCEDSSSYDAFFTLLKDDLEVRRAMDLSVSAHHEVISEYVQLRNAWLKSDNLSNFRMALVITKALCQVLGAEALAVFEEERTASGLKGPELLDEICLTRDEVFTPLNGHFKKTTGSYQPLEKFKGVSRFPVRDSAWMSYIVQFDLEYRPWGAIEYLSLPDDDPILLQLNCFRDHLRDSRPAEIVQRSAVIVDYRNKLSLIYAVLDSVGENDIDRSIVKVFSEKNAKLQIEYLFSSTSIPDHQATQAFSFLNFLAIDAIRWRCPRLIDDHCE